MIQNASNPPEPQGDDGGDLPASLQPYGSGTRARLYDMETTRLINKCLKLGAVIPDQYKPAAVNRQVQIAIDPKSDPREATSAFKALTAAEALKMRGIIEAIRTAESAREREELIERLKGIEEELGIGNSQRQIAR